MANRESTSKLIRDLLSDGVPRTAGEIVEALKPSGLTRNRIDIALTTGAASGKFCRDKVDLRYVYRLPAVKA